MSVQPIDLQVLMSHIPDVGREQAVQQNAAQTAQVAQGMDLVTKTDEEEHSVNESKQPYEVEATKDRGGSGSGRGKPARARKGKGPSHPDSEVFTDPAVGHNVDLSG